MAPRHLKLEEHFEEEGSQTGQFFRRYSRYLFHLLANLDFEIIEDVANLIIEKSKQGNTVYVIGNGGSATTATHFASDLSHSAFVDHRPLVRAVSLVDNMALITAVGNDRGYDEIFSYQIDTLMNKGDVLIAISASGNSPNILKAAMMTKEKGGYVVGITGFDGGKLGELADYTINVATARGEYGPVEDVHLFLDHMISAYIGLTLTKKHAKISRRKKRASKTA
jgi:D-sedoheptulose 7-phosphate isomerase